jgi:hypothetical protein
MTKAKGPMVAAASAGSSQTRQPGFLSASFPVRRKECYAVADAVEPAPAGSGRTGAGPTLGDAGRNPNRQDRVGTPSTKFSACSRGRHHDQRTFLPYHRAPGTVIRPARMRTIATSTP